MSSISKYLADYAEPETASLDLIDRHYRYCLVIPACDEEAHRLKSVWQEIPDDALQSLLIIVVINAAHNAHEQADAAERLARSLTAGNRSTIAGLLNWSAADASGPDLLLVDRYSAGNTIPERQGVGLARKIGLDIALSLYDRGRIESPWLYTTDADARLPSDYFEIDTGADAVAAVYPFCHEPVSPSMLLYEIGMLYYAAGLINAGSPYGYTTIGSTITCEATAYARVRGLPKRSTGEDFYLLNKLRKLGPVTRLDHSPVLLSARHSTRVPVGTGQAVARIDAMADPIADYRFEHPDCFTQLEQLQSLFTLLADQQPGQIEYPSEEIRGWSASMGFADHYLKKQQSSPATAVMFKHLTDWFDGLRTRQFVHYMRDQHYGTVGVHELPVNAAPSGDLTAIREILLHQVFTEGTQAKTTRKW